MKKETEFGKYLIIEWGDIEQQPLEYQEMARHLQSKVFRYRKSAGKNPEPRHLVLNQEDDISVLHLSKALDKFRKNGTDCYILAKVNDIAVALENAILKTTGGSKMIIFCSDCGYRTYTVAQAISQEVCNNCGQQGSMKELRLKPENVKREVQVI